VLGVPLKGTQLAKEAVENAGGLVTGIGMVDNARIGGADDAMEAFIRTAKGNEVKIDLRHIFLGDVSKSGKKVVGFHHISGVNPDRAKILSKGILDNNGLYEAEVQIFNQLKNNWQTKNSTFFPDSWTRAKTLSEIRSAWYKRIPHPDGGFTGRSSEGIYIRFFSDENGGIRTAFPVFNR